MPMNAAASAINVRVGTMMRASCTVSASLAGSAVYFSAANARTSGSANTMPSSTSPPVTTMQRVDDVIAQPPGRFLARQREIAS